MHMPWASPALWLWCSGHLHQGREGCGIELDYGQKMPYCITQTHKPFPPPFWEWFSSSRGYDSKSAQRFRLPKSAWWFQNLLVCPKISARFFCCKLLHKSSWSYPSWSYYLSVLKLRTSCPRAFSECFYKLCKYFCVKKQILTSQDHDAIDTAADLMYT